MALLPPTFLDTVAAIGVGADPQHRHWIGTGFIFGLVVNPKEESKRYRLFVFTNKHVFKGNKEVYVNYLDKKRCGYRSAAGLTGSAADRRTTCGAADTHAWRTGQFDRQRGG